ISANDRQVTFSATDTVFEAEEHYDLTLLLNDDAAVALPIRITAPSDVAITSPDVPGNWDAASNTYTIPTGTGASTGAKVRLDFPEDVDFNTDTYRFTFSEGGNFPSSDGWSLVSTSFMLTVNDPEAETVGFATSSGSVNLAGGDEGDTVTLTVRSSVAANTDLVLPWTVNDNADNDDDIMADSGTVMIQNGMNEATFDIDIRQDNDPEAAELVTVTLSDTSLPTAGWQLGVRTHDITIAADDNTIKFASASATVAENAGVHNVEVEINSPLDASAVLNITRGGSATFGSGNDYTVDNNITLPISMGSVNIPVTINDDNVFGEVGETIELTISGPPTGWTVAAPATHTLTITDNDTGMIGFKEEGTRAPEPAGAATSTHPVTLTITGGTTGAESSIDVGYGGTADRVQQAGVLALDYEASETVTVPAGTTGDFTFNVTIRGDELPETDETVIITIDETRLPGYLSAVQNDTMHVVTIPANDHEVVFGNTTRVNEVDGREEMVTVSISQSIVSGSPDFVAPTGGVPLRISVLSSKIAVNGNFNAPPGADSGGEISFDENDPAVYFADIKIEEGQKEVVVPIYIVGDQDEDDEIITLQIEPQPGVTFPSEWGMVLRQRDGRVARFDRHSIHLTDTGILNPSGEIGFTLSESRAPESVDPHKIEFDTDAVIPPAGIEFKIGFTGGANNNNDIRYDGTFLNSTTASPFSATVMPGANSGDNPFITVDIANDAVSEADEVITFMIIGSMLPPLFTLDAGAAVHQLTIPANDNRARFAANANSATIDESTGQLIFEHDFMISLPDQPAPSPNLPLLLEITGGNEKGTATFNSDGTRDDDLEIRIPAHGTGAPVTVYLNRDQDIDDEEITFTLTEGTNFPDAWGIVPTSSNTYTLDIMDTGPITPRIGFVDAMADVAEGDTHVVEFEINTLLPRAITLYVTGSATADSNDALYNGNNLQVGQTIGERVTLATNIQPPATSGDAPSISIQISDDPDLEGAETITLHLHADNFTPGFEFGTRTHVINIAASDSLAHFPEGSDASTVQEGDGRTMLKVSLSGQPAPAPNLPLTLTATDSEGNPATVVSFMRSRAQHVLNFTIDEGATESEDLTVFLRFDNDTDPDVVTFTLTEGNNFPSAWGSVPAATNEYTLTIEDSGLVETGRVGFKDAGATVPETGSNITHPVALTVTGTVPADFSVPVRVASASTATAGAASPADFAAPGSVNITTADGGRDVSFNLTIFDNPRTPEDTETIVLEILQPDLPGQIRLGDNPTYTVTIPIHDQLVGFLASTTTADETAGSVTANLRVLQTYGTTPAGGVPVLVRIISGNEDGFVSLSQQHLHNERTYTIPGGRRNADVDIPVYFKVDGDNQNESIRLEIFEGENFPGDYALIPTTTTRFFDISITDTVSGGDPQVETTPFPSPMVGFAGVGTTVSEPASGTTPVPVAIVVTDTVPSDFSLNIERGGVGDRLSEDYSIRQSLPLSISRGTTGTAETILVDITADTYAEYEEEITLTIPSEQALPANWVLGNASYKITIPANGNMVSFATDASTAVENGATASVAVNIEQPFETDIVLALTLGGQTGDISVAVASTSPSGTAVYSGPDNTLTIPAGAQSVTLTVTATDDNDIETGNETATLTLGGTPPSGWTIAGTTVHTVTIPPNDLLAVGFAQTAEPIKAVEGGAAQQVNLSLPENAPSQVILQLAFSGAPESAYTIAAVAPATYDPSAKTLTIASGASSAAFTVTANDNDGNTSDETLEITLSPGDVFPATWQVPADTSVDVVLDDSAQTTVGWASAGPLTLRENDVEMLALHISDPAPAGGLPLTLAAAGYADSANSITAAGAGDYEITTEATFTIAENGQTYAVGLTITDDPTAEMLEGLRLTLGKGTNFPEDWTLDPAVLDITIAVNDQHKIGFVQDGASTSFAEGESKMLGVELSQAHSADILVAVDVAPAGYADDIELAFDGTVLAANDHLTIDSNDTQVDFEVRIKDDAILENEEMYTLTLRGVTTSPFPSEYSIDPSANTYTLTIQPSDVPVEFDSTVTEPVMLEEGGTPAMVGVRLPTPVAYPFNYDVSVVDAAGNDSLTDVSITATDSTKAVFDTTENSISVLANTSDFVLQIGATSDNIPEADETLTLKLLEGSREADTLEIRIAANGNSISLASPPASIPDLNEGDPYELVLDINAPLSAPAKLQIAALENDNLGTDTSHRNYPVDLAFAVKTGETATFETDAGYTREFLERDVSPGIICPGFRRCARTTRGTLTIPAGVSQVTLLVTALSDGVAERDENVAVEITPLTGADALPDAWTLDIPRETRFRILPNENRMNFRVGQGETFERTVEEGGTHLLRVQQVENFPPSEFNDNVVRAVLRVVETDTDELPEITIRSGKDTSWDADSSTMTFTSAQSDFSVDVIDDDRREAEERVTLRLEQPTGADAYPSDAYDIGSNGTFTIIIPGGDNKISFASFDQSSQAAFAQGSIRACRGFHDGTNGSTENSARICAAERTHADFNYVRSIAIDAPLDAQAKVRLSLDDQNEQTSMGEFQIHLAGGNPQGTNWDEASGLLTIPARASQINLRFEFYSDQEIHLPGDQDYLLTLEEVVGERLPTGWSIDGDASTLPIRILDFTGRSVVFNNSQAHHEEGSTARITMDISETMPADGIPIFVYMYDNPRNLPVSYNGQRFSYTPHPGGTVAPGSASDAANVAMAMEVQLLPGTENGAGSSPSASPYFDIQIGNDDVPDLESYFDLRLDTNQTLNRVSRPDRVQTISLLYVNVGAIAKVNLQASDNEVRFVSSSTTFTEESGEVEIEIEVVHPTRFKDDRDSTGARFNAWPNDGIRVHVDATEMTTDLRATNFPRLNQPADSWFTYDDRGYHTTLEWGQPRFLAHDGGAWQFGSNASEGFLGDGHADFSNQRRGDLFIPARDPAMTGDISQKVSIRLNVWDDNVAEDEETYTIRLSEATKYRADNLNDPYPAEGGWGLSGTRNMYTITIPANDNYVTLTGSHASISESGVMTTLDLTLSNPAPTGGVPLVLSIPDGNPDASFDAATQVYTKDVMIDAGDTEATNIPLFINGNQMHQPVARNVVVSVAKAQENFPNVWGDILS
ncbi:MAG: hypothetical protein OXF05_02640, partial [Hyphomicrobiales bacterium]|nr:hypothetical protein [Hyphomicrobiales bacterium]